MTDFDYEQAYRELVEEIAKAMDGVHYKLYGPMVTVGPMTDTEYAMAMGELEMVRSLSYFQYEQIHNDRLYLTKKGK